MMAIGRVIELTGDPMIVDRIPSIDDGDSI